MPSGKYLFQPQYLTSAPSSLKQHVDHLIGLCEAKKTFLMSTPKHLGVQIFRQCPLRYTPHSKLSLPGGQLLDKQCLK